MNESMSFLGLENKTVLVMGVANRKSVAWFAAKTLEEAWGESYLFGPF